MSNCLHYERHQTAINAVNFNADRIPGLHSGSFLPVGTTTITYTAKHAQNNTIGTCSFKVKVNRQQNDGCNTITQYKAAHLKAVPTDLQLAALPNPSTHYFYLHIQSSSEKPVQLRIVDELGRAIEIRHGISSNSTLSEGLYYRPGVYYAEAL